MMRRLARALALTWIIVSGAAIAEIQVTDDTGQQLVFKAPVARIISLAPHTTEMLFAAGAGERIVGTIRYSDFPDAAAKIPNIGDSSLLDFERIVALKPELIVVWLYGSAEGQLAKLRRLGIPIYYNEPRKLTDIATSLIRFGQLAGTEATARRAAGAFTAAVDGLREQYANRSPVRLFYQVWNRPLLTVNGAHLISDVIRLCGGENIFAALKPLAPVVSMEAVLSANPEAIVTGGGETGYDEGLDVWRSFKSLHAATGNHFIVLKSDNISRHTTRIVDGARALCEELDAIRARRGT